MGARLVGSVWSAGGGHSQKRLQEGVAEGRSGAWPKADRRWASGKRQIIEGVIDQLKDIFALERHRAKTLGGLLARLAAKMAAYTCGQQLNDQLGRPLCATWPTFWSERLCITRLRTPYRRSSQNAPSTRLGE